MHATTPLAARSRGLLVGGWDVTSKHWIDLDPRYDANRQRSVCSQPSTLPDA